jgi:hypothetical protein
MDLKAFWLGWRRDIVRFAGLCLVALAVGLLINRAKAGAREHLTDLLPSGSLDGLDADLDFDEPRGPRRTGPTWTYRTRLSPGQAVSVRDLRGSITVEPGQGESLEVVAVKWFSRSDPQSVRLVTVPTHHGVAICALWGDHGEGRCGPGDDDYKAGNAEDNDVGVEFTVRLPRGVPIRATTVTGSVRIAGATAPVVAGTVDGEIDAATMRGPVRAYSVNGDVRAAVHGFADTGAVKVTTVNGSVTLELPATLDATVSANTINGDITSDFPLTTSSKLVAHHASGVVGGGGRRVELTAVNGSVRLVRIPSPTR